MGIVIKIVIGIVALFFLVLIHELGHFIVARMAGVKVESFSLGFGPILLHKSFGGTDYRLSAIPLGGYCALKGEKDLQQALDENAPLTNCERDSLYGVHPLKRALIGVAGPAANLFFAYIALCAVVAIGYRYSSYSSTISVIDGGAAKSAGVLSGDKIIKIDGETVENFSDIIKLVTLRAGENVKLTVEREEKILSIDLKVASSEDGRGIIGVKADISSKKEYKVEGVSFPKLIFSGAKETAQAVSTTVKGILTLFQRKNVTDSVSGVGSIVDIVGTVATDSAKSGAKVLIVNLANILAYISISLFIMNMLPIPILDGSLILFALIEAVTKKKLSPKLLIKIQFIGAAIILALFILATVGDVKYFMRQK